MRAYHKLNPPAESKSGLPEIAKSILSKPNSVEVDFAVNNMVSSVDFPQASDNYYLLITIEKT